jgi:hypothetical protein
VPFKRLDGWSRSFGHVHLKLENVKQTIRSAHCKQPIVMIPGNAKKVGFIGNGYLLGQINVHGEGANSAFDSTRQLTKGQVISKECYPQFIVPDQIDASEWCVHK